MVLTDIGKVVYESVFVSNQFIYDGLPVKQYLREIMTIIRFNGQYKTCSTINDIMRIRLHERVLIRKHIHEIGNIAKHHPEVMVG